MSTFTLGFYGFGEAASTFARGLRERWPGMRLVAYDVFVTGNVRSRASALGVELLSTPAELASQVTAVASLVTGSTAFQAAEAIRNHLGPGRYYIDFNSISPNLKTRIGDVLAGTGASVVDASVMGSVPENGLGVSILLSGSEAELVHGELSSMGFRTKVAGEKVGQAAAIKMVRSVFAKGLEGLFVEMLLAARKYGVEEPVVASIVQSLENKSIRDVMNLLVVSQANHSARKKTEMDNVMETLQDAGVAPIMSTATRDVFEWLTGLELGKHVHPETADYRSVIEVIERLGDSRGTIRTCDV